MVEDVVMSEDFEIGFSKFSSSMKKIIYEKIRYLCENPKHPSLNVHQLRQIKGNVWDCYISYKIRLLYEFKNGVLHLWNVGSHSIVDKAHIHSFASSTRFRRVDIFPDDASTEAVVNADVAPEPSFSFPDYSQVSLPVERQKQGTPNHFAFFQNAHLRILGVPASRVQELKKARTLEDALSLSGLSEQTKLWLAEIATSPELEQVIFDPSRLLYRTTLDRLEGYCEGKIKRLMLNLQRPEQQQYVDMDNVPLMLLKGAAGSGKTTVGIYRAIRLASQGRLVLVVTYNKTLVSITRSLIEELIGPLPKELKVMSLHGLMMTILRQRQLNLRMEDAAQTVYMLDEALNEVRKKRVATVLQRDRDFFQEEIRKVIKGFGLRSVEEYKVAERFGRKTALNAKNREAVWEVYEAYQRRLTQAGITEWADVAPLLLQELEREPIRVPFDDIIVDEAQDCMPVDLQVIQRLVDPQRAKGGKSSLIILADAAQSLYSRGFSWKQAGIQVRGRTAILRKNYRNTRQIAEASAYLLTKNTLMRSSNEYVDPEWTQRQGSPPIVMKAQSSYNQLEVVRNQILDLVSDQTFRLSDFAVLCPTNQLCQRCKATLEDAGLRTVYHKDSEFDILEERIKILTIHSAKGLEFPVVFLVGLTGETLPSVQGLKHADQEEAQLYIEQQRMLCYVGMTRAAEALYLVTVRGLESRFIHELADKVAVYS